MRTIWQVEPEWQGERAFIIGGGPSVLHAPIDRLFGRKVIAINSSYEIAPFADILFFADARWWQEHKDRPPFRDFAGRRVSTSPHVLDPNILGLFRRNPPGLCPDRDRVVMQHTGVAAAINLAVHLGARSIVLVGADGGPAHDGRTHHHTPHPWPPVPNCWKEQMDDLRSLVGDLIARGVAVVNASPDSAVRFWPRTSLADFLDQEAMEKHS